jgi:hypothetical protein
MPEIVADPLSLSCCHLFLTPRIEQSQQLGPDPFLPCAHDAGGRFVKGSSGNPRRRPLGIPNPKRRVPDLATRPLTAQALSDLIDRKPHLLRSLPAQLLPSPLASIDPAERLGIDLSSLRTDEDFLQVLASALTVIARGEITPAEGVQIAERVDALLRATGASHGRCAGRPYKRIRSGPRRNIETSRPFGRRA